MNILFFNIEVFAIKDSPRLKDNKSESEMKTFAQHHPACK